MTSIFISHSAHDRERIEREIIGPLREHGLETWYSRQDIQGAAAWERSIREALNQCDWFLVALSPAALASEWVQTEVHWALEHRSGRVVPVLLEPCDPTQAHLKLGRIQHIDFTSDPSAGLERLLAVWGITTRNAPVRALSSAPVARPTVPQHVSSSGRYLPKRTIERDYDEVVVLAHDREHGTDVLVRVRDLGGNAAAVAKLQIDALRDYKRLRHPSVLRVVDVFAGEGYLSIVTEECTGARSLSQVVHEGVDFAVAARIIELLADGLHYLHTKGIVHGELSPHDIVIDDQGRPLLTNLGIHARHLAAETGDQADSLTTSLSYLPAEARQGRARDVRTDVWSLGAILYELLTHRTPEGRSPARAPTEVDARVPPELSRICMRCLASDPADRYQTAADLSQALRRFAAPAASAIQPSVGRWREHLKRSLAWLREHSIASLIILLVVGGGMLALLLNRRDAIGSSRGPAALSEGSAVRRLDLLLPDSAPLAFVGSATLGVGRAALAISPDGNILVYVAQRGSTTQLYLRHLERIEATPLRSTEGAYQPFFSPDGQWIGFFAQGQLKKVSVNGGPPVTLAAVAHPFGAAWAADDRILLSNQQGNELSWVPSGGGTPQPITRALNIRVLHPELLPDGQSILHGAPDGVLSLSSLNIGRWYAITTEGVVPRETVDASQLLYGSNPRYLESGHISYISRDGVLMVLPFDVERRRVLAPPFPVLEGVRIEAAAGGAQFTVSRGGTVVYAPGANLRHSVFVWVDHATGQMDTLPFPRAAYGSFDLAPDGQSILVRVEPAAAPAELWVFNLAREERRRVPTSELVVRASHWWADAGHIVYSVLSDFGGDRPSGVTVRQSLAEPSNRDTLFRHTTGAVASPQGTHFAGVIAGSLKLISFPDLRDTVALPRGLGPVFSPDGRWLAYVAPEPELEVYVTPIDRPRERYKISTAGGEEPVWKPDGRTLIYRNGQEWLAVPLSMQAGFRAARPRLLLRGPFLQVPGNSHDISADGRRQLLLLGSTEQTAQRLVIVTNWLAEVTRAQSSATR